MTRFSLCLRMAKTVCFIVTLYHCETVKHIRNLSWGRNSPKDLNKKLSCQVCPNSGGMKDKSSMEEFPVLLLILTQITYLYTECPFYTVPEHSSFIRQKPIRTSCDNCCGQGCLVPKSGIF